MIGATGATSHHFLALDSLVAMLNGFFAAYVIPPGIYARHRDFDPEGQLSESLKQRVTVAGQALVEMYRALASSSMLPAVEPQI